MNVIGMEIQVFLRLLTPFFGCILTPVVARGLKKCKIQVLERLYDSKGQLWHQNLETGGVVFIVDLKWSKIDSFLIINRLSLACGGCEK